MPTAAILRHELPDGSWHHDWLIATAGVDGDQIRDLVAFRIQPLPWDANGPFDAQLLEAHRRLYLRFEGELGAGRGRVTAVWRGEGRVLSRSTGGIEIELVVDGQARRFTGRAEGARWRFERV
jgi:hypothetical protein